VLEGSHTNRFPANPIYPATPCQRLVSLLFEVPTYAGVVCRVVFCRACGSGSRHRLRGTQVYADEWLVIPAMHYRWSFPENLDFIYREFGRTNLPDASASAQVHTSRSNHTHTRLLTQHSWNST
jgi:hypothetical protein